MSSPPRRSLHWTASSTTTDDQFYTYNFFGDTTSFKDQNGSVHTYTLDPLGRETLDVAGTLGSGVYSGTGVARALGYSFDSAGHLFKATTFSNTAATTVVNQVERLYNGFGQLTTQYQEHAGTVNTGSSQKVQYTFDQSAGGVNESRLRGMVYPDGRTVDNAYGTLQMSVSLSEPGGGSTTVTGTTSSAHGLQAGDRITISGASPAGYDGTYTIATVPTSTTFTYTDVAGLGTTTGSNITFSRTGQTPISSLSHSTTTATVTTAANHDLVTGDKVQIEGAADANFDGIFTVTVTSATTFTYTMANTPSSNTVTDGTASLYTLDTAISRVSGLQDHAAVGSVDTAGTALETYSYLGLNTIVQRSRPQTGVNLTYKASDTAATTNPTNDGGDVYTGLDRFGRIVDQNWVKDSTGVSTDRWQYGYDAASNVLYKNNLLSPSNSELYHANSAASGDNSTAYDPLNRLQAFRRGTLSVSGSHYNGTSGLDTVTTGNLNSNADHSQSYTLDVLGNQTSVTTDGTAAGNTVNSRNQKTAVNGTSVTFDNNGNALTGVGGAGTLTYDAWGDEITSATCSTSRTYDALGRMVVSTVPDNFSGSAITKKHDLYYSTQWQELQDTATWTASGCGCGCCCTSHSDKEQYVWGKGYVDDLVLRDRNPDSAGFTRLYVQQDANYNVTAITNTSGAVQERFIFTPFGQETTLNANWTLATYSFGQFSQDSNAWIYGFQGWRYDSGTGFYTVRNRDYDVIFGWVGADPTGGMYIDGMNLYQAEGSNPVGLVDPSGLDAADSAGEINEADNAWLEDILIRSRIHREIQDQYRAANERASARIFTDNWIATIVQELTGKKLDRDTCTEADWKPDIGDVRVERTSIFALDIGKVLNLYEIKPHTKSGEAAGIHQLARYMSALAKHGVVTLPGRAGAPGTQGAFYFQFRKYTVTGTFTCKKDGIILYDFEARERKKPKPVPEEEPVQKPVDLPTWGIDPDSKGIDGIPTWGTPLIVPQPPRRAPRPPLIMPPPAVPEPPLLIPAGNADVGNPSQ